MDAKPVVLIADDDASARATAELLLRSEGYDLLFANDGAQALATAAEAQPDVILCDLMMPDIDGLEVCRRVRAMPELAEVPLILITALDDQRMRLQGLEAGADEFVTKPYSVAELRLRVRMTLRLNRYRRIVTERTRLRWVLDQSTDGYLALGAADDIHYANAQSRAMLGLPMDVKAPLGQRFLEWVSEHYHLLPAEAWRNWPRASTAGPRMLVRPESATAPAFWLQVDELTVPGAPDNERLLHLIDVSEAVSNQREQITIGRIMSHKLRTPVGQIVAATELLQGNLTRFKPDELAGLVDDAHGAACRLELLVDDVLQYLDAPNHVSTGAGLPVAELPQLVQALCAREALPLPLIRVAEDAAGLRMPVNRRSLESVLWQLLENSRKFHPMLTPQVEVGVRCGDNGALVLTVADDGSSLPPEQLRRVWQPYSQIEKRFTGERAGAGLGLAMVATVVWSLGGECRMWNRVSGPGVVVELVLPALQRDREVVDDSEGAGIDRRR